VGNHPFIGLRGIMMELFDNIHRENVAYFAGTVYNNPKFTSMDQFHRDLRKITHIKRNMNKFDNVMEYETHVSITRKIINHIITYINIFGHYDGLRILFSLMEHRFWGKLKSLLEYIYGVDLPIIIHGVNNEDIIMEHIEYDEYFKGIIDNEMERGSFDVRIKRSDF